MSMTKLLALVSVLFFAANTPPSPSAEWYVDGSVPESGDGSTWATAFKKIQEGIDAASDGDTVVAARETYLENIEFNGDNIAVRSVDPLDPQVVGGTVIDGNRAGAAVTFYGTEGETCVLSGFTIRNGSGEEAAGILGGRYDRPTRAEIENNVIKDNTGTGLAFCDGTIRDNAVCGNSGGGLYRCNGVIRGNIISGNQHGGGLVRCYAVIEGNTICDNRNDGSGGGLHACIGTFERNVICRNESGGKFSGGGGLADCDGVLRSNIIDENVATNGGGLWECGGVIENNLIRANSAQRGSGGGLAYCAGRIRNNIISTNESTFGGGLYDCDAILENNTICHNQAQEGGGLHGCQAEIRNCIIWGNKAFSALYGHQLYLSDQPTYSCIQDWTGGGEGNIAEDPQFVDPDGPDNDVSTYEDNDFRLRPASPCIDAGFNAPELPQTDIAGNPRIMFGGKSLTVDIGAYEYYIIRLNIGPGGNETILTWSSLASKSYSVFYSEDLLTWHLADGNVPSSGDETTSWVDDGSKTTLPLSLVSRRFYRVLENP